MHSISSNFQYSYRQPCFPIVSRSVLCSQINFNIMDIDEYDFFYHRIALPPAFSKMVAKRRCEFLAGRICAQIALNQHDSSLCFDVGIDSDRSPCWPRGIIGSITHTSSVAAACIASTETHSNIGIDTESILSREVCASIASEILTTKELYLLKEKALPKELFVTLAFSAKESIFKAIYKDVGYIFGFDAAMMIEFNHHCMLFVLTKDLSVKWKAGDILNVGYQVVGEHVFTSMLVEQLVEN
ncbi:4'-phosphopantetheinyl transferase entD [Photobacterium marinum]|uniref:Enterobactin synthase component D n=2 Tax=Photobacterium marinum TaxID=1056511 RepID=L8JH79_9GAMM|nr:4'-phosphopantetheinyl transferase entD [Photobacterium marinum]